jgi:uncharacterized protein YfkK (UPF0435 family)
MLNSLDIYSSIAAINLEAIIGVFN